VSDQHSMDWLTALKATSERLDTALTKLPVDKTALLVSIGEGVSLLLTREMERIAGDVAPVDDPDQMKLFPGS